MRYSKFGVVDCILVYARGRMFDPRTVQTFVFMNIIVLGLVVSMYNIFVFTKSN
jgi:Co/Zn/Cd efflux system component